MSCTRTGRGACRRRPVVLRFGRGGAGRPAIENTPGAIGETAFRIPERMQEAERAAVRARRRAVGIAPEVRRASDDEADNGPRAGSGDDLHGRLTGLALSGGGIRSATFALGVLQRLACADLLKRFDYLSTVSGGGYIGGSLTWLLSRREGLDATGAGFPYGVRRRGLGGNESNVLRHLRLHGNYLTPGKGITPLSLAAVVLRGIVLNLLIWLPLMVLFFWGLQRLEFYLVDLTDQWEYPPCLVEVYVIELSRFHGYPALLILVAAVFVLLSVLYSLATWRPVLPQPYRWRRRYEQGMRWLVGLGVPLAGLVSLPLVRDWLFEGGMASLLGGAVTLLTGLGSGLGSFFGTGAAARGRVPVGLLAAVASALVLYGLAFLSYDLAERYLEATSAWVGVLFWGAVAVSLLTGWLVNVNYISLHRYYRDRLMEAFLPRPDTDGTTAAAVDADRAMLSDMCLENGPYHLVNANLVLWHQ